MRRNIRERVTSSPVSYKNILGGLVRLFLRVCLFNTSIYLDKYFPYKYINRFVSKGLSVTDLFYCCRLKSVHYLKYPLAKRCPAVACSDYMLLLFHSKLIN